VVHREAQTGSAQTRTALGVQVSPRRPTSNVNRTGQTCLLSSGLPEKGVWCEPTAFRHSCARSSKRAGAKKMAARKKTISMVAKRACQPSDHHVIPRAFLMASSNA